MAGHPLLPPPGHPRLSRRRFLALGAAGAGAALLAACGDDEGDPLRLDDQGAGPTAPTGPPGGPTLALAQFLAPRTLAAGGEVRIPFSVSDIDGLLPPDRLPGQLELTVVGPADEEVVSGLVVERHDEGLERGYYPLVFEAPEPGVYTARTEHDGDSAEMSVQVHDAGELSVILPGRRLPDVATPTTDDDHGVTPICTREPRCPLHEVSLTSALEEGRPLALLVATPAFCAVAICGPVLDVLLEEMDAAPEVRFLHAEVYEDPFNDTETTTEIVGALELHYEPVLVLADATGTVVERLDMIYDRSEVRRSIGRLASTA